MRLINLLVATVFTLMALIQFNDPDPMYWIAVYAATAWVAGGAAFGRSNTILVSIVIGMAGAGLLMTAPGLFDYLGSGNFASIFGDRPKKKAVNAETKQHRPPPNRPRKACGNRDNSRGIQW